MGWIEWNIEWGGGVGWEIRVMEREGVAGMEWEDIEIAGFGSRGRAHPNFSRLYTTGYVFTAVFIQPAPNVL